MMPLPILKRHFVTLCRCFAIPMQCCCIILSDAYSPSWYYASTWLCATTFCSHVPIDALSTLVYNPEIILRPCMALFRSFAKPLHCYCIIISDAFSIPLYIVPQGVHKIMIIQDVYVPILSNSFSVDIQKRSLRQLKIAYQALHF